MHPVPFTWNFRVKDASVCNGLLCKKNYYLCGNLRLVFRDVDPENMYASVINHDTIRMVEAIFAAQHLKAKRADVYNAYLCGDMDKSTILKQSTDSSGMQRYPGKVCFVLNSFILIDKQMRSGDLKCKRSSWIEIFVSYRGTDTFSFPLVDIHFSSSSLL